MDSEKYTSERKYSLIDKKTYEYLEREKKNGTDGLCFNKFKADFVIDNDIQGLKIGDKMQVNDILITITKVGKNCFPNDCDLYKKIGSPCMLATCVAFAK